jgi:hypothetical protein
VCPQRHEIGNTEALELIPVISGIGDKVDIDIGFGSLLSFVL